MDATEAALLDAIKGISRAEGALSANNPEESAKMLSELWRQLEQVERAASTIDPELGLPAGLVDGVDQGENPDVVMQRLIEEHLTPLEDRVLEKRDAVAQLRTALAAVDTGAAYSAAEEREEALRQEQANVD
jgi:hypothetical protein